MNFKKKTKEEIIEKYGKNKKDTGSSEIQIALLTEKINKLQKHFINHKKDHNSKRGLLKMVSKRRKQLNYLKDKNINRYTKIIASLKLRH